MPEVEALRPQAVEPAPDLDLVGLAQLGAEVDLDPREDEVAETAENADAGLLEVRRVGGVVDVTHRVAVFESEPHSVDERELAQRAAGSKRSFARLRSSGTRVGYERVKQARQTDSSGSRVAACIPSSER